MKDIIYINSREDARQFSNCSTMTVKQLDIFGSQPQFRGETFVPERDGPRLVKQLEKVRSLMKQNHGLWQTLAFISAVVDAPEASVSARLRDIKREGKESGEFTIERRYVRRGLHEYRLVAP